jgi:hypothetical protein
MRIRIVKKYIALNPPTVGIAAGKSKLKSVLLSLLSAGWRTPAQ